MIPTDNIFKNKYFSVVFISTLLCLGLLFYWGHLSGAMPAETDENRCYHFTLYAPLLYILCSFFTHLFRSFDAPYYVIGLFGILNIALIFTLARRWVGDRTAYFASLFYATYEFPLAVAKILSYATMVCSFILLYWFFLTAAYRLKQSKFFAGCGACLCLLFISNPSTYAVILGLLAMTWLTNRSGAFACRFSVPSVFWPLLGGFLISYMTFEWHVYYFYRQGLTYFTYEPYWKHILWYQKQTNLIPGLSTGHRAIWDFFLGTIRLGLVNPAAIFRNVSLLLFTLVGLFSAFRRRYLFLMLMVFFLFFVVDILMIGASLKIHVFHRKPLAWTVLPISLLAGWGMTVIWEKTQKISKGIPAFIFVIYFILATNQCAAITKSIPSSDGIQQYLKSKHIHKRSIVSLYPLIHYDDIDTGDIVVELPTIDNTRKEDLDRGIPYLIHWPVIYRAYQMGIVKYYLSSGVLNQARVGYNDVILKDVKPIKVWDIHPLNNPYLFPDQHETYQIKLYALWDIFERRETMTRLDRMIREKVVFTE